MILNALEEWDWHIHHQAAVRLLQAVTNPLPDLIAALKHPTANVRERAAYTLGELGNPQATQALIHVAPDDDSHVRYHVIYALERIKAADALMIFIHAVEHDTDADVRYRAARGLGVLKDRTAVPVLIQATQDEKLHVRHSAIQALGFIGDERAIEVIAACREDKSLRIRQAAESALTLLRQEHSAHFLHINGDSVNL